MRKVAYNISLTIIFNIFITILTTTILWFFKTPISVLNFVFSSVLTLFFVFYLEKNNKNDKNKKKNIFITISSLLFLFASSFALCNYIKDTSWDGTSYHMTAVEFMKNGFNPIYDKLDSFNKTNNKIYLENTFSLWNDHYTKAYWIYAANIYMITGNINLGTSFSLLLSVAICLFIYYYLSDKIKNTYAVAIPILFFINPISLTQYFTYYNDGVLGLLLVGMIFTLLKIIKSEKNNVFTVFAYMAMIVIISNIKFTGLAYSVIYLLPFGIYLLFKNRKKFLPIFIYTTVAYLMAIFVVGYNPYITNTIRHHHPLHPLAGKKKVDIMDYNTPVDILNRNRFKKIVKSNFSETNNTLEKTKLKIPFTFRKKEPGQIGMDTRIGGYGILFSGVLMITTLILAFNVKYIINNKKYEYVFLGISTLMLFCIMSELWWARYFPQLGYLPIINILLLVNNKKGEQKNKYKNALAILLIVLITLNTLTSFGDYYNRRIEVSNKYERAMIKIKESCKDTVYIKNNHEYKYFNGDMVRIKKYCKNIVIINNVDDRYEKKIINPLFFEFYKLKRDK